MSSLNKYKKLLFILLSLAFIFAICGEPIEAGTHTSDSEMNTECCLVCHPLHGGICFEEISAPKFSIVVFSKVYPMNSFSLKESPVFPLFHPPRILS